MDLEEAASLQEAFYDEQIDYTHGSPHLSDARLRQQLDAQLLAAVRGLADRGLPLRVLEIGAGHGGFTEPVLAAGAKVTAVDMSRPALELLQSKYGTNPNLTTVFSEDGGLDGAGDGHTLLLCASVLHHIPDYVTFLKEALTHLQPGASVLTFQDPLWYPRLPRGVHALDRAAYFAWRIPQGNLLRGAASVFRRNTGRFSEDKPGDMVEYHVVRQGVDEKAVVDLLEPSFERVELRPYWSNQLRLAHNAGRRFRLANCFGVFAEGLRHP